MSLIGPFTLWVLHYRTFFMWLLASMGIEILLWPSSSAYPVHPFPLPPTAALARHPSFAMDGILHTPWERGAHSTPALFLVG